MKREDFAQLPLSEDPAAHRLQEALQSWVRNELEAFHPEEGRCTAWTDVTSSLFAWWALEQWDRALPWPDEVVVAEFRVTPEFRWDGGDIALEFCSTGCHSWELAGHDHSWDWHLTDPLPPEVFKALQAYKDEKQCSNANAAPSAVVMP